MMDMSDADGETWRHTGRDTGCGTGRRPQSEAAGLGLPERHLLAEIGIWLARTLAGTLRKSTDATLCDDGIPALAQACRALADLDVYTDGPRRTLWRVNLCEAVVHDHVMQASTLTRAGFERALLAYLVLAAGHQRSLPDTRAPFAPPSSHTRVAGALVRCGYLSAESYGQLAWTEAVAALMCKAHLWDRNGNCLSELWDAQDRAEARLFLLGLPERLRAALRRQVMLQGPMAGLALLRRHWAEPSTGAPGQGPGDSSGLRIGAEVPMGVYSAAVTLMREGAL